MLFTNWKRAVAGSAAFAAFAIQGSVSAQSATMPWENATQIADYVHVDIPDSGWSIYPVVTSNSMFIGFFGYLPKQYVVGNNISLVWMTPDNGDGTWSMYGWSGSDVEVASDYLDNVTGSENILECTGLGVFLSSKDISETPQSMPLGISINDPAAAILEISRSASVANTLISAGAAGAPSLAHAKNSQPIDPCNIAISTGNSLQFTELDEQLASYARTVTETMNVWMSDGIADSLELTGMDATTASLRLCWPCLPSCWNFWGPWSAWTCTGGPTLSSGGCRWTGCTRTRTGTRVCVSITCATTSTPITGSQGPRTRYTTPSAPGTCP